MAFGLVLLTLPFGYQPLANVFLLLAVISAFSSYRRQDWLLSFRFSSALWAMLLFVFYLLSQLWTSTLVEGWERLGTKLAFFIGPLLIYPARAYLGPKFRQPLLWAFIGGCMAASLFALGDAASESWREGAFYESFADGGRRYFFTYTALAHPVMHPGYFATFIGLALMAALSLWPRKQNRILLILVCLVFLVMLWLLQSRISMLALFVVALIWLWSYLPKLWRWLGLGLGLLGLIAIIFIAERSESNSRYLALPQFNYDISGDNFNSATYRLAEWACARQAILDKPWLGHGVGDAREALFSAYRDRGFKQGLKHRYNAHNQYLETALAIGLLGTFLLLFLGFSFLRRARRHGDRLLFYGVIFFLISLLTESMFERAWAVLLFNLYFPLLVITEKAPT